MVQTACIPGLQLAAGRQAAPGQAAERSLGHRALWGAPWGTQA